MFYILGGVIFNYWGKLKCMFSKFELFIFRNERVLNVSKIYFIFLRVLILSKE